MKKRLLALVILVTLFDFTLDTSLAWAAERVQEEEAGTHDPGYLTSDEFDIEGMPQQNYSLTTNYKNGVLKRIDFSGSVGYIIEPTGNIDPRRRWVWVVPLWLSLPSEYGNCFARYYVEGVLEQGFHVVGFDVGTSLGSPKAAKLFNKFHTHIVEQYDLMSKPRMIAVSNGGLITFGYAFRHPERISRIMAIYPALDFRTWPTLEKVVGPGAIAPQGLAYELSSEEMSQRITEFNPIDNLKPLANAGVSLFHIHGDADELVPLTPNSAVALERYRNMGGAIRLKVLPGSIHGGTEFFTDKEALEFLTAPTKR